MNKKTKRSKQTPCTDHGHDPSPTLSRATALLKGAGLRSTGPRRALLEAMARFHSPFSTEELFQKVVRSHLDLVTVYRSLATFHELAIVHRVDLGDGVIRYELASADGSHHHHFICNSCHRVEPLDFCEIQLQEDRLKSRGYSGLTHRLEFFGLCPDCS